MTSSRVPAWRRYLRLIRANPTADLDDEIAFHLAARIDELVASGLTPEEARAAALTRLGDLTRFRAQTLRVDHQWEQEKSMRDSFDNIVADVTFALRQLRRTPALSIAAVLCFALGIGANSAIFSIVNGVLIRPLPYRDVDRLVVINEGLPKLGPGMGRISAPEFMDYRELEGRIFQSTAIYEGRSYIVRGPDGMLERVQGAAVSGNFLKVLGREPALGRIPPSWVALAADPAAAIGTPEVIVSHSFWRTRLGGDSTIIGKSIPMGSTGSAVVAAVMPPNFQFPIGGIGVEAAQVFAPLVLSPAVMNRRGDNYGTWAFGRLADSVSVEQASAAVSNVAGGFLRRYPASYGEASTGRVVAEAVPARDMIVGSVRRPLLVLFGAVCLVLLIACLNVSSLLVARSVARQREIAVRRAIGASRSRLAQQFLTESLVLVSLGGALGLLLGRFGARLLQALDPNASLSGYDVSLDWRVVLATVAMTALTAIAFSVLPGLAGRDDLQTSLREATAGQSGMSRGGLVVAEIAIALLLTVGAGLMVRSFYRLRAVDPGFDAAHVLTFRVTFPSSRYPSYAEAMTGQRLLAERLRGLPGVEAVSTATNIPIAGDWLIVFTPDPALGALPEKLPVAANTLAQPGYFEAMQIPLRAGRAFSASDVAGQAPVVIISEVLAKRYYGGSANALGKQFKQGVIASPAPWQTIIGVVADVKQRGLAEEEPLASVYMAAAQLDDSNIAVGIARSPSYVIRTQGDPRAIVPAVRKVVAELDSRMPISGLGPMSDLVASTIADRRFNMFLLAGFALVALSLAAIGIYGLVAYSVAQRTRELGIRIALGAVPRDVLFLVVRQGASLALVGIVLGSVGAIAATRLMKSMLFQIDPLDPLTFGAVGVSLAAVAIGASWIPALRAAKVSPVTAMRGE